MLTGACGSFEAESFADAKTISNNRFGSTLLREFLIIQVHFLDVQEICDTIFFF